MSAREATKAAKLRAIFRQLDDQIDSLAERMDGTLTERNEVADPLLRRIAKCGEEYDGLHQIVNAMRHGRRTRSDVLLYSADLLRALLAKEKSSSSRVAGSVPKKFGREDKGNLAATSDDVVAAYHAYLRDHGGSKYGHRKALSGQFGVTEGQIDNILRKAGVK